MKEIWKTIKLGTYKNTGALRKALQKAGCYVSSWADDIMDKVKLASEETEVDLVVHSVAELGFQGRPRYDEILARAKELGLELCPAEVGPQLRLQYKDQPTGEWLRVVMEPLADSDVSLNLFYVDCDDDVLWLGAYYDYPVGAWYRGCQFVFVARK